MAVEMFLRLDGVAGGSRNYHHQGWADMLSWTWGLNRARVAEGEGRKELTRMNEIAITKVIGVESAAMMNLCAQGTRIKDGAISVVPVVGKREAQRKYVVLTMENLIIKSIATGANTEETVMQEKITLGFGRIRYEYFNAVSSGTPGQEDATECHAFGWDLASNAAC